MMGFSDDRQVGGNHYINLVHQPIQLSRSYDLHGEELNIVKYVTRWPHKGGLMDLRKALHFGELLVESADYYAEIRKHHVQPVPYLTWQKYCEENQLGVRETRVIQLICGWSQELVRSLAQAARTEIPMIIFDAKKSGWKDPEVA